MTKWIIVTGRTVDNNRPEYQVSDGEVNERTVSYDFENRDDAVQFLEEMELETFNEMHKEDFEFDAASIVPELDDD